MPTIIDDARRLIRSRLADLDAEAKSLERALGSLGKGSGPRRRRLGRPKRAAAGATPRPKGRSSRKRKSARAPRGQRRKQLLAAIKANPGARPAELAGAIGVKPPQVHTLIGKARDDGLIARRGRGYALNG